MPATVAALRRHRLHYLPQLQVDCGLLDRRFGAGCHTGNCRGACCRDGVWVDTAERDRILANASRIQAMMDGTQDGDPANWFDGVVEPDRDFPSGVAEGTQVVNGRCVFLDGDSRCTLQRAADASGGELDLRPFFCKIFPLTLEDGVLMLHDDLVDGQTQCCSAGGEGGSSSIFDVCSIELDSVLGAAGVEELRDLTAARAAAATDDEVSRSTEWLAIAGEAARRFGTPCYVSAWQPVEDALARLRTLDGMPPVRHWLSLKTHPVAPLVRAWRDRGRGIEVISEYELRAVLHEGFTPDRILVNGVAKHTWLPRHPLDRLRVHFDSWTEIAQLSEMAQRHAWRLGVRCHVTPERDPDDPPFLDQFGFMPEEAIDAIGALRARGLDVEGLHFHLSTNVRSVDAYRQALADIVEICRKAQLWPRYVDCGGGLPVISEHAYDQAPDATDLDLSELRRVLDAFAAEMPGLAEIWFENGRFVTSHSAVLVVRVHDVKERPDCRYVICDGGRTNHAIVSAWESHEFLTIPERRGEPRLTTVCGPTCMAWDWIIRAPMPGDIGTGDVVVWLNAGAYHVPWESRFSHGLSQVIWCDERGTLSVARDREDFARWWGSWK